jgi:hypothetical protein
MTGIMSAEAENSEIGRRETNKKKKKEIYSS